MTTNPGRSGVAAHSGQAPDRVTPLLKGALPPGLLVGAGATVVAALLAGSRGALGAALGVAIVVLFSGTGLLVMRMVRTQEPMLVMVVAMGSYALRIVLFGAALALTGLISGIDAVVDRRATAITVLVTVLAWVVGEIRAFTRLRVPTYDIELPPAPSDDAVGKATP